MPAGQIPAHDSSLLNCLPLTGSERKNIDTAALIVSAGRGKQDRVVARQNLRPAVDFAPLLLERQQYRRAATGRNPRQSGGYVKRRDDVAIVSPTPRRVKHRRAPAG